LKPSSSNRATRSIFIAVAAGKRETVEQLGVIEHLQRSFKGSRELRPVAARTAEGIEQLRKLQDERKR
jgi:hypothetical protein